MKTAAFGSRFGCGKTMAARPETRRRGFKNAHGSRPVFSLSISVSLSLSASISVSGSVRFENAARKTMEIMLCVSVATVIRYCSRPRKRAGTTRLRACERARHREIVGRVCSVLNFIVLVFSIVQTLYYIRRGPALSSQIYSVINLVVSAAACTHYNITSLILF